jgi:hypothetical protein
MTPDDLDMTMYIVTGIFGVTFLIMLVIAMRRSQKNGKGKGGR